MKRIRVMVVDDSLQFASAVGQFLACNDNFEVLARASTERPDLMFIDISMPGMNGLAVTSLIKGRNAAPKIVMMTLEDSEEHRIGAIAAGADAFLPNFAHGFHAVLDLLFAESSLNKESRAWNG